MLNESLVTMAGIFLFCKWTKQPPYMHDSCGHTEYAATDRHKWMILQSGRCAGGLITPYHIRQTCYKMAGPKTWWVLKTQ
jgi:hypothetical protein